MIADGIRDWLARDALPGRKIITVRTLTGGHRNDNTLLVTGTGDRYVLRRYLLGNTCAAEAALAARLAGAVPVPEVVAADPEGDVAGEPVLLSDGLRGRVRRRFPRWRGSGRRTICGESAVVQEIQCGRSTVEVMKALCHKSHTECNGTVYLALSVGHQRTKPFKGTSTN